MGDLQPMSKASGNTAPQDDPAAAIPGRIKALRTALNLTATEMDRKMHLCTGTTGRLERGTQRVYASHLYRIAEVTGVDVGWFYRTEDEVPHAGSALELEKQKLVEAYMRITDPVLKHDVCSLIESLSTASND